MFDVWSLIIGIIIGACGGLAALTIVQGNKQPDDEPEYWFKQLGHRKGDGE